MTGTDTATYLREQPGMSAFALEDGAVYHTYSTYARGLDGLWGNRRAASFLACPPVAPPPAHRCCPTGP